VAFCPFSAVAFENLANAQIPRQRTRNPLPHRLTARSALTQCPQGEPNGRRSRPEHRNNPPSPKPRAPSPKPSRQAHRDRRARGQRSPS
jgi:hypothetical protein